MFMIVCVDLLVYPCLLVALASSAAAQYQAPRVLADVRIPKLTESSGMAASRLHPGVVWTHNDSGKGPWLFAIDRKGKLLSRWQVAGARSYDWEDMAIGPRGLYIGDIGDNGRKRPYITVYRIPEPNPNAAKPGRTAAAEGFRFTYPDGPHDAEALLVHPKTGDLYIVSKAHLSDSETAVYRARAPLRSGAVLQKVAVLHIARGLFGSLAGITGGAISPDGSRVVLCDYFAGYEAAFDPSWKLEWKRLELGQRAQGEGICYRADGRAILATSEGASFPLIEVELR